MARQFATNLIRLILAGGLYVSLSGCSMLGALGHFVIVEDLNHLVDEVNSAVMSQATATICIGDGVLLINCTYIVDGESVHSTVSFVTENSARFAGFDPLILEVPSNVISATATYDTSSGPLPLPINRANSFPVTPGTRMTAEVGTTFLFFDLPVSVTSGLPISNPAAGPVFSYTLSFQQQYPISATVPPVTVKPMMAGAVTVLWQTYYVPLLPCVTDFASIPAVTIPLASSPQDLETSLGDLIRNHSVGPCNHKVYDFTQAMRPPGLLFLPLMRR